MTDEIAALTTDFSEQNVTAWLRRTFVSFAADGFVLGMEDALFARAGVKKAVRLGFVALPRAKDDPREVELPVFLVRMERMGMGPQRKIQFACAKRIIKGWGAGRGALAARPLLRRGPHQGVLRGPLCVV